MNKGERSEFYAFLHIINSRKIYFANQDLKKTNDYIDVTKISQNSNEFIIFIDKKNVIKILNSMTNEIAEYELNVISESLIKNFFHAIKNNKTFSSEEQIKELFKFKGVKGKSNEKADLQIAFKYHDLVQDSLSGISVKSSIGANPTLLNASRHTNIIYKVVNFRGTIEEINEISTKSKIIDRVNKIIKLNGQISYHDFESETFKKNIKLVDSSMDELLANKLLERYIKKEKYINNIVKDSNEILYFKKLLNAASFGMFPSKEWDGYHEANGIINIEKNNGDLSLFHILQQKILDDYLFNNTYFETPDSRNNFGKLYQDDDKLFFKLNIDIRMKH